MASSGNEHCANCIGTLSFPMPPPIQQMRHYVAGLSVRLCVRSVEAFKNRDRHDVNL